MADLRVLKTPTTDSQARIVALLEELLAEAKAGKMTGVFIFSEDDEGKVTHSRDGMSDSLVVFWLEIIRQRVVEAYR